MMDQFLSIWPKGLFGINPGPEKGPEQSLGAAPTPDLELRKRPRDGSRTPTLVATEPPAKRFRAAPPSPTSLSDLPEDLVASCLDFVAGDVSSRFAVQATCRQFRRITNRDSVRAKLPLGGDPETGLHGIIREDDTPKTAMQALMPFARARNPEALYMIGIIGTYCSEETGPGLECLMKAEELGYVQAAYALGMVLRDSQPQEAAKYLSRAAKAKYLPALQEMLSARHFKSKYGEPKADELRKYMDALCLNRLLARYHINASPLRTKHTSHCWNPLCGRWAYKVVTNDPQHECVHHAFRVSRMKMCSRCCRAKYCSKLCQVYDWRSGRHKMECQFL